MTTPEAPRGDHEEAIALQRRAKAKLARVRRRTPVIASQARRLVEWGEINHLAPKMRQALRGE